MKLAVTIIFCIVAVALLLVVLSQEGKGGGLTSSLGGSDTYWSKNKGRSKEALLVKITVALGVTFMVLAIVIFKLYSVK